MAEAFVTPPELASYIGHQVVVDTDSSYVYIGTLTRAGTDYLELEDVDVHDTTDSRSTKEHYAHETKKVGPRGNRKATVMRMQRILSISRMDDVISF